MSPDAPPSLNGATALVTGASGGLGRALVAELIRRRTRVAVAGRDANALEPLGADAMWAGDLREPHAPEAVVEFALQTLGSLQIIVNAAGVVAFGPVTELAPPVAQELLETDALVPMLLAAAALSRLRKGGTFVNLTGVAGEQSIVQMAAYCGAKAAAASFMRAAAREGRRAGIRVLDARPGHTETGLATRPLAGTAPNLPDGLTSEHVARVICDAIATGERDLPPAAFEDPSEAGHDA
jgi:cyclic-di-GMP-binding biofilm dispersal mediator protein